MSLLSRCCGCDDPHYVPYVPGRAPIALQPGVVVQPVPVVTNLATASFASPARVMTSSTRPVLVGSRANYPASAAPVRTGATVIVADPRTNLSTYNPTPFVQTRGSVPVRHVQPIVGHPISSLNTSAVSTVAGRQIPGTGQVDRGAPLASRAAAASGRVLPGQRR